MRFGVIGSGSWATALAKILADKGHTINWWIRNEETIAYFKKKSHNPQYLPSARFDVSRLRLSADVREVVRESDVLVIAIPVSYTHLDVYKRQK